MDTSQKNLPRDIYFRDAIYDLEQIKNTLTYAKSHVNTYLGKSYINDIIIV